MFNYKLYLNPFINLTGSLTYWFFFILLQNFITKFGQFVVFENIVFLATIIVTPYAAVLSVTKNSRLPLLDFAIISIVSFILFSYLNPEGAKIFINVFFLINYIFFIIAQVILNSHLKVSTRLLYRILPLFTILFFTHFFDFSLLIFSLILFSSNIFIILKENNLLTINNNKFKFLKESGYLYLGGIPAMFTLLYIRKIENNISEEVSTYFLYSSIISSIMVMIYQNLVFFVKNSRNVVFIEISIALILFVFINKFSINIGLEFLTNLGYLAKVLVFIQIFAIGAGHSLLIKRAFKYNLMGNLVFTITCIVVLFWTNNIFIILIFGYVIQFFIHLFNQIRVISSN